MSLIRVKHHYEVVPARESDREERVMSDHDLSTYRRREFLQASAGAIATATALTLAPESQAAPQSAKSPMLPRRMLGKTGVDVTILNLGTWRSPGLNRLIRFAYASGVRYFDTADCYGSEPAIAQWLQQTPEVRKEIFLVTKDHPNTPRQLIAKLDERLAALEVDHVDLFFIHGIGKNYGDASLEWPKSKELKETIEAIKKSGKARFVGFSCHDARKAEYLQAAAEGGFVDAIMLQFTPWLDKDSPLNRALDACHKRGIGLISMKQVAGQSDRILQEGAQAGARADRERSDPLPGAPGTPSGPTSGLPRRASRCGTSSRSARTPRPP